MDASTYQQQAARTLISAPNRPLTPGETMMIWCAVGISGESGELVDSLKKAIFHEHGLNEGEVIKEMGDLLWYIAGLCTVMGIDIGEVMAANIEKLKVRYPAGFRSADSVARVDVGKEGRSTKTLRMYGASDDLITVEGIEGADEYNSMTHGNPYVTSFVVMSPSEPLGLQIHVLYAGGWSFAVQPTEDKDGDFCEFPTWPIRRTWGGGEYNRGYSELLEIDVPDDATIKMEKSQG